MNKNTIGKQVLVCATGGLPTGAGALNAINAIEATDANWSIALTDKLPVAPKINQ